MVSVRLLGVGTRATVVASSVRLLGVGTNAGADSVIIVSPPPGTIGYPGDRFTVVASSVSGTPVSWSTSGPLRVVSSTGTQAVVEVTAARPTAGSPPSGRVAAEVVASLPTGEMASLTVSVVPQVVWAWSPTAGAWVGGGPEPAVPVP